MKVTELMIGDWVLVKELDPFNLTNVISEYQHQLRLKDFAEMYNAGEYKEYEPIPLTEEILQKNGFEKKVWWKYRESDVTTYAIGEGFHIELSEDEFWLVDNCSDDGDYGYESNGIKDVKYVHKLQHLLKDLEIEKEIIL